MFGIPAVAKHKYTLFRRNCPPKPNGAVMYEEAKIKRFADNKHSQMNFIFANFSDLKNAKEK